MTARELIDQQLRDYTEATNAGDVEALLATLADDILYKAPDREVMRGKAAVGDWAVSEFFDVFNINFNAEFENVEIINDHAYAYGNFKLDLTPKTGGDEIHLTGAFFDIMTERKGTWKLKYCIYNYDQPIPAGSETDAAHAGTVH